MIASPLERGVTAVLESGGHRLWGVTPRLMAPAVRQLGPLRALRWFAWNMPRYLRTLTVFGGLRTHLVGTAISLINGCPYCTYGEAYAFQLIHLRDRGFLFPLDEHAMGHLCGRPPAVIRSSLVDALQRAGLHGEVPVLDRTIALAAGGDDQRPTEPDDVRLAHLVGMLGVLNSVGVTYQVRKASGEALDPVNKDCALKRRYARLRAESSV